uniref:spermatogenesis-associated protein 32 n=1 Tax=Urocitellus parryii TaxID=9999 RepID=UPI000E55D155|nr:spermatogenesis-associated protein 32 [Urocitellus parryii]
MWKSFLVVVMWLPRLPTLISFSLPGANGFPCCGKGAVDIVEIPDDFNSPRPHPRLAEEEEDLEVEDELLEQEPRPRANVDSHLDSVPDLEDNSDVDIPERGPEAKSHNDPYWEMSSLDFGCEHTEQQYYTIETLHPYTEEIPRTFSGWSIGSNSSLQSVPRKELTCPEQRSIRVQTSKHLFWANKLIQASEHSLQQAINRHHPKQESNPKNTLCPENMLQISRALTFRQVTTSQPLSSPCLSTSSLPPSIGLEELINFASSLAVASNDMELPSLEQMIKAPSRKSAAPSKEPVKPCTEPLQPQNPPKAKEPEKVPEQEKQSFPSYLDFKPGIKRATIEGEVKFLPTQDIPATLQECKEDSVPGTKKGNPLFLKIHFKLSSPSTPEK